MHLVEKLNYRLIIKITKLTLFYCFLQLQTKIIRIELVIPKIDVRKILGVATEV